MHYVFGGIPAQIATVEQGIVSCIQKLISHFGLEILRDVEGSKSIALEGLFYFRLISRYDFTSSGMELYQLLS